LQISLEQQLLGLMLLHVPHGCCRACRYAGAVCSHLGGPDVCPCVLACVLQISLEQQLLGWASAAACAQLMQWVSERLLY